MKAMKRILIAMPMMLAAGAVHAAQPAAAPRATDTPPASASASTAASAAASNPFFGDNKNQIGITYGRSTGPGGSLLSSLTFTLGQENHAEDFNYFMLQYSQPTTFFRLPARLNGTVGITFGNVPDAPSQGIAGISEDVAILHWRGFYYGYGLGGAIQGRVTKRENSQFVFSAKSFLGYRITDAWSVEIVGIHYSNAGLNSPNRGYNFIGLTGLFAF